MKNIIHRCIYLNHSGGFAQANVLPAKKQTSDIVITNANGAYRYRTGTGRCEYCN